MDGSNSIKPLYLQRDTQYPDLLHTSPTDPIFQTDIRYIPEILKFQLSHCYLWDKAVIEAHFINFLINIIFSPQQENTNIRIQQIPFHRTKKLLYHP